MVSVFVVVYRNMLEGKLEKRKKQKLKKVMRSLLAVIAIIILAANAALVNAGVSLASPLAELYRSEPLPDGPIDVSGIRINITNDLEKLLENRDEFKKLKVVCGLRDLTDSKDNFCYFKLVGVDTIRKNGIITRKYKVQDTKKTLLCADAKFKDSYFLLMSGREVLSDPPSKCSESPMTPKSPASICPMTRPSTQNNFQFYADFLCEFPISTGEFASDCPVGGYRKCLDCNNDPSGVCQPC